VTQGAVVTIGVFDGVHRGHQALIGRMIDEARATGYRAIVVTFDPNPLEVLRPEQAPTRLTSLERRVELLTSLGADDVTVLDFTADMAALSAEDFLASVLIGRLNARGVVIGHGFRFGHRAQGSAATLREGGLEVEEYALLADAGPISSTRIRALVGQGQVAEAAEMLGRPAEVSGQVVAGQRRGRDLGYPTANVEYHQRAAVPADGVYAGYTEVGGQRHAAAISVGTNPTFAGQQRTVESHVLDFDGDLYGQQVRVEFVQRLRSMQTFAGVADLVATMDNDVARTRIIVSR
jgi:riboflavin kinase/FMN adenylyltransferase